MGINPLSKKIEYSQNYNPNVLHSIPRAPARSRLNITDEIKMFGVDHWRAYEISWLDVEGKPTVRFGELFFRADSVNLIESKSLKLYLNSFNSEKFAKQSDVEQKLITDLSALSKSKVNVVLHPLGSALSIQTSPRTGTSIDKNPINIQAEEPLSELLQVSDEIVTGEKLYSDLFRSNCPITGQPDWASFHIEYTGHKLDAASLLTYLCAYRSHQGYHEECTERIFRDILLVSAPVEMRLSLNFLRRGGIEINVYRSMGAMNSNIVHSRLPRQ